MAVLSVTELAGRELDSGEDTSRRWRQRYQAFSNVMDEHPLAVLQALAAVTGITKFSVHAVDGGCLCTSIVPRQDTENPFRWEIDVTWSSLSFSARGANVSRSDPAERTENPLQRPIDLRIAAERYTRVVHEDIDGDPIRNSANEPFDPLPEVDDILIAVTVSRNESTFDLLTPYRWVNRVNSDEFLGIGPGHVRVMDITADRGFENNVRFFKVTYLFHVTLNHWGWKVRKLDQGWNELVDGKSVPIKPSGLTPTVPYRLDGNGRKIADDSADKVWKDFDIFEEKAFAELGLF